MPYYLDVVTKVLPSMLYLATKTNEDCFNCFNRLAPTRYSILQYSKQEKQERKHNMLAASSDKGFDNNKLSHLSSGSVVDSKRMMMILNGTEVD